MDKIIVETFSGNGKVFVNYVEVDGVKYHPSYSNLLSLGFEPASTSLFRGYVSRKEDPREALANVAAKVVGGRRTSMLYVEMANPDSTNYSIRQYLKAPAPLEFREYQE